MNRYLLNISYIGTMFRGVQKQLNPRDLQTEDPMTIQGQIEIALKRLKPGNVPYLTPSSRTDAGVHAFHTTMHVDLVKPYNSSYEPQTITILLNKYFAKKNFPIRILSTYLVPESFHCRKNAVSRTYLYRFAVIENEKSVGNLIHHVPIEEFNRCLFVCSHNFDVEKAREACKLFEGLHDFRSFMGKSSKAPDKNTRRVFDMLRIENSYNLQYSTYSWPHCSITGSKYKYYNVYVKSNGFLYRQVRRTVASLIAVAQGKVTARDIKFMIEVPSHRSWNPSIKTAPAHGLYLCEVAYSQNDIGTFRDRLCA